MFELILLLNFVMSYPLNRLRRLRKNINIRSLVSDVNLACKDLIYPIFCLEQDSATQKIESLPGIYRLGRKQVLEEVAKCLSLGVNSIALFPVVQNEYKDDYASYAYSENNFLYKLIKEIKLKYPEIVIIADVALDPYTSHGHDGVLNEAGEVANDQTIDILVKQALLMAESGADIIAPSDMMDGRIGKIRQSLDSKGFSEIIILSYSNKFASNLYSPFRDAIGSSKKSSANSKNQLDKKTYQLDYTRFTGNFEESTLDIEEGADILMVKPAHFYQDIIVKLSENFDKPIFSYQVSGEYSMMKSLAKNGNISFEDLLLESLYALKRSGSTAIITYGACEAAKILKN